MDYLKRTRIAVAFARWNFLLFWRLKTIKNFSGHSHNYKQSTTGKKGGGIVGITKAPSAVSRWALYCNLRSHIAA